MLDFKFNGQKASEYGLIPCYFDNSEMSVSGGDVNYITSKSNKSDRNIFHVAKYDEMISWTFSVMKNPCKMMDDEPKFTQNDESRIAKWLVREDGYKWLEFDAEGYEDVCFLAYTSSFKPHKINGDTIGFDITFTTDSPWGYTNIISNSSTFNYKNPFVLYLYNDNERCIYPYIELQVTDSYDDLTLNNTSDVTYSSTHLYNLEANSKITMDSCNRIIDGLSSPNNFNYRYIRLLDGKNILTTNSESDISIKIKYREIRRIFV